MRYAVLGSLELRDGDQVVRVEGLKERTLLAVLLASRGSVVSGDELLSALWGDAAPRSARRTLEAYVARLRAVVEPEREGRTQPVALRTAGSGWLLSVSSGALDSGRFEDRTRLAAVALSEGRFVEASGLATLALSEWRGLAYDGFVSVDSCGREAARLDELRAVATEQAAESGLALGPAGNLIGALEQSVAEEPLRERRWAQLMLGLYRCGRQAEALQAYRRARTILRDEVGVDPGPELQRLQQDMLRQAPSLLAPMLLPPVTLARAGCPFKGLAAYTEADAEVLLGRARLVAQLVARLADGTVVCLVGASGGGKSSVLHAGLLPALRAGAVPGSEQWRVAVTPPGERPDERLAAVGTADLVIIDQLEEMFTLCSDAVERQRFAVRLAKLSARGIRLALAVRSDYWADCAAHPELADMITSSSVLVGPLSDDELRRVVTEGARRVGLSADDDLVEALVADAGGQLGILPLVSTALVRTWERRDRDRLTLRGYHEAGGINGAVAGLAEDTYTGLETDQQRAARAIMTRLAADGRAGQAVRRRASVAELAPSENEAAVAAFWQLVTARLIYVSEDGAEVAHEAVFASWPRLATWLADDAAGRRLRRWLTPAAVDWDGRSRPEADLYRGPRLIEALDWQAGHPGELIGVERDFLKASARWAEREKLDALARADRESLARRRLRWLLTATTVMLVVAVVAGAVAIGAGQRARSARNTAVAEQLGAEALLQPRQDLALQLAAQAMRLQSSAETRSDLLAAVLRDPRALHIAYIGHRLIGAAVSPDGRTLAVSDNEGEIRLLDAKTLKIIRVLQRPDGYPVSGLGFTSGGQSLLSADQVPSGGARVETRDVSSGRIILSFPVADAYTTAITPDGSRISSGAADGGYLWRRSSGTWRETAYGAGRYPTDFSSAGRLFVVVDSGHGAVLRSERTGAVVRRLPKVSSGPAAALSPDGRVLATSDASGVIRLWSTASGRQTGELVGHSVAAVSLVFSQSGALLLSAGGDGTAIVWDVAAGQQVVQVHASQGPLYQAVFSPDDRTIYTVAEDGTVASWDVTGRRGFGTVASVPAGAQVVTMAPDGSRLLVGTGSGQVAVLSGARFFTLRRLRMTGAVTALSSDPASREAAVGTAQGELALVDLVSGAILRRITGFRAVGGAAWSPDGRLLAVTDPAAGRVRIVDAESGAISAEFRTSSRPGQVAWSGDGHLLAVGILGSTVAVVDPTTGRLLHQLKVSRDPFAPSVAFAHGPVLAVGARDGSVRFWNAATGRPVSGPIPATTGVVEQLSAGRNGTVVAASGDDGSLVLLDAVSYQRLGTALPPPPGGAAAFAVVDSRRARLVAVYGNGAATVWPLDPSAWMARACSVPGGRLSLAEWRLYLGARPYAPAC